MSINKLLHAVTGCMVFNASKCQPLHYVYIAMYVQPSYLQQLLNVNVSQQLDVNRPAPLVCFVVEVWIGFPDLRQLAKVKASKHLLSVLLPVPSGHSLQPNTRKSLLGCDYYGVLACLVNHFTKRLTTVNS